ncbi:hypothetical protein FACS189450_12510 [Spirochaetia bacterium]|nr:hypothetical protein FACS189450_12510 [Spirochaetia bacterium]
MNKYLSIALLLLFFSGLGFSQENQLESPLKESDLRPLANNYLRYCLNIYLQNQDLEITETSVSVDLEKTTIDTQYNYYFIESKFNNYRAVNRNLAGEIRTEIRIKRSIIETLRNEKTKPQILPNIIDVNEQKERILLLIDDELSENKREAELLDRINKNFHNPIDVQLNKSPVTITPDRVTYYVSFVVNRKEIKYVRAIFQRTNTIMEEYGNITIQQTLWVLQDLPVIFEANFPDDTVIRNNKDINKELFKRSGPINRQIDPKKEIKEKGSKVLNVINEITLENASNGMIRLKTSIAYRLDFGGFIFTYWDLDMDVILDFKCTYDEKKNQGWDFIGLDILKWERKKK